MGAVSRIMTMTDIETLRQELIARTLECNALAYVVNEAWDVACDGGDCDGDMIQKWMIEAGLCVEDQATEDDCDNIYGLDVGDSLCRLTDLGRSALKAEA